MKSILALLCLVVSSTVTFGAQVIYVSQSAPATTTQSGNSWNNAYRELRDALGDSRIAAATLNNPVEIRVATGTYKPTAGTNRLASFVLKSHVHILGGYLGQEGNTNRYFYRTFLSGDIGTPQQQGLTHLSPNLALITPDLEDPGLHDNSYNVLIGTNVTNIKLDLVVITGGNADYDGITQEQLESMVPPKAIDDSADSTGETMFPLDHRVAGGGMFFTNEYTRVASETQLTLFDVAFAANVTRGFGGGLALRETGALLAGCQFFNNVAGEDGGGMWAQSQRCRVAYSTFEGNLAGASGGGVDMSSLPSSRNVYPQYPDRLTFEKALKISRKDMEKALGMTITGAKLAANAYRAYQTSSSLSAMGATRWQSFTGGAKMFAKKSLPNNPFKPAGGNSFEKGLSGAASAYACISMAVALTDFGMMIAEASGADMDNDFCRGWAKFSTGFNTYATPQGWASLTVEAIIEATNLGIPTMEQQMWQVKSIELNFFNQQPESIFAACTFENNISGTFGGGMNIVRENVRLEGCEFNRNHTSENGGAVAISAWTTPMIYNCSFQANTCASGHSAIANHSHARTVIVNCTLVDNSSTSTNGYCVGVEMGSDVRIFNSILWGNTNPRTNNAVGGADVFAATAATLQRDTNAWAQYQAAKAGRNAWVGLLDIKNSCIQSLRSLPIGTDNIPLFTESRTYSQSEINTILANKALGESKGVLEMFGFLNIGEGIRPTVLSSGNIDANPMLVNGIYPSLASPVIDAGDTNKINNGPLYLIENIDLDQKPRFQGRNIDMGAIENNGTQPSAGPGGSTIIYVKKGATGNNTGSSWANAVPELRDALALAPANASIWVAAGTYVPDPIVNTTRSFNIKSQMAVYGGFNGTEVSLSQRNVTNNVTILSGNIGDPGNSADNSDSIVTFTNATSRTILDGFTIAGARTNGAIYLNNSSPMIQNCIIRDNRAVNGAAVHAVGSSEVLLVGCALNNNIASGDGGAVYGPNVRASNCRFETNSATTGGAVATSTYGEFVNCAFYKNSAVSSDAEGGAIYSSGELYVNNCTLVQNSVTANILEYRGGGGIEITGTNFITVQNSILWNNTVVNSGGPVLDLEGKQVYIHDTLRGAYLSASLIEGLDTSAFNGEDNLTEDPQFVNLAAGNLRLRSDSPAVDAGKLNRHASGARDLDGSNRVTNVTIDMGAYEFQGAPNKATVSVSVSKLCNEDGPVTVFTATLGTNATPSTWQWDVDKNDGAGFVAVANEGVYSGATTGALTITYPAVSMDGYRYRVRGVGTQNFTSASATLAVNPPIIYVRANAGGLGNGSSWANAFTSLTNAIQAASDCTEIWVAAGTYYPGTQTNHNLALRSGLRLYGGFVGTETNRSQRNWKSNVTTISGNIGSALSDADNSDYLFFNFGGTSSECDSTALLDGFTLREANKAAMRNVNASPTIRNCAFINNRGSYGGALANERSVDMTVANCVFDGNSAGVGGAISMRFSTNKLVNCLFINNRASYNGGAIENTASKLQLVNCTVANNISRGTGGALFLHGNHQTQVLNSILWGNYANPIYSSPAQDEVYDSTGTQQALIVSSCVRGWPDLVNNTINVHPLFVNPAANNFQLDPYSPAVNTGTNSFITGITNDLNLSPRLFGGTVDMGAYELQTNAQPKLTFYSVPTSTNVCSTVASVTFSIVSTSTTNSYNWQINTGSGFTALITNATYTVVTNTNSSTLTIISPTVSMNGYQFRVGVSNTTFYSTVAQLNVTAPGPIYVKADATGLKNGSSWANAYTNLQDALVAAGTCNEIWVAQGTYVPTISPVGRYSYRMRSSLPIYGGFNGTESSVAQRNWTNNPTILRNNGDTAIFENHAYYGDAINESAILDGFYIQSTNRTAIANIEAFPTIRNCFFLNNGGIAIGNNFSGGRIVNCTFSNNLDSAILNRDSSPLIQDSLFISNRGAYRGGAVYNRGAGAPRIENCLFTNNAATLGGAVLNSEGATVIISRSRFFNNAASSGGAIYNEDGDVSLSIDNSLLVGNEASFKGGAICSFGTNNIENCTITQNRATFGGGGLYAQTRPYTVRNSILWGNTVGYNPFNSLTSEKIQVQVEFGATASITNSCIQGLATYTGNGNISFEPLFLADNVYSLSPSSPAINAGNSNQLASALDLAANARVFGTNVDLGSYELQTAPSNTVNLLALPQSLTTCLGSSAAFSLVQAPGSVLNFTWQYDSGGGFVNVNTNDGIHRINAISNVTTLIASNVAANMTGWKYRVAASSVGYNSVSAILTVKLPRVIYVNPVAAGTNSGVNWAHAFTNVQDAINTGDSCSEVWVAKGTNNVTPSMGRDYLHVYNGLRLYGGFAGTETALAQRNSTNNPTVLQGNTNGPVFWNIGHYKPIDYSAVIDGFVIRSVGSKSGIMNSTASPTIRNCRFENSAGTGVWNENGSSPMIADCVFTNLTGGAIHARYTSDPFITNCLFVANSTPVSGAGVSLLEASATVSQSRFFNNLAMYAGGAISSDKSTSSVVACVFSNNVAISGGGAIDASSSSMAVKNSVFHDNRSDFHGGAMAAYSSSLDVINSTVSRNSAEYSAGGIYQQGGTSRILNTIVWNNSGSPIYSTGMSAQVATELAAVLTVSNSCLQAWNTSAGSISTNDPLFVNPGSGNFALSPFSPSVNAGANSFATGLSKDINGNARLFGANVDIGAYELQSAASTPLVIASQSGTTSGCNDGYAAFIVSGATNLNFQWQINSNGTFVNITNTGLYVVTQTNGYSSVEILPTSFGMNGHQFRFVESGSGYTSAPYTLSMGARTVRYVNPAATGTGDGSSWANAMTNLQAATLTANSCTEIWVKGGTYTRTASTNSNFLIYMKSGVAIYGGFAGTETSVSQRNWTNNPTILLGNAAVSMVYADGARIPVDRGAILDGFTITGIEDNWYGGVACYIANPTLRNCTFTGNAGISIYNVQSSPWILSCSFANNTASGIVNQNSSPRIANSSFLNNRAVRGVGIENSRSSPSIEWCTFRNNSGSAGAGIYNDSDSGGLIANCSFIGNSVTHDGGAIHNVAGSSPTIRNCLIARNSSDYFGGGIYHAGSALKLVNCTIVENSAAVLGGGIYNQGTAALQNNILWNNSVIRDNDNNTIENTQIYNAGSVTLASCTVQGLSLFAGSGNGSSDPLFRQTTSEDWQLTAYSPALNAGTTASYGTVDLQNSNRVFGASVDVGAYEFQGASSGTIHLTSSPSSQVVCSGNTAVFTVVKGAGTTNQAAWLKWNGSSFSPLSSNATYLITTNSTSSTLSITNISTALNGEQYRFTLIGSAFTSPTLHLTVTMPQVLYVSSIATNGGNGTSWATAYKTMQQAFAAADGCSEIWVKAGTYHLTNSFETGDALRMRSGLKVYGGFFGNETARSERNASTNLTVLKAGPDSAIIDNQGLLVPVDSTAVIDGFVFTGADVPAINNFAASPTIQNCAFTGNTNGVIRNSGNANVNVSNCVFTNNFGISPIVASITSSPTFRSCVFSNNSSTFQGGVLYFDRANATIELCQFAQNSSGSSGGAIYGWYSGLLIKRSIFDGNTAGPGGAIWLFNSAATLNGSLLANNVSSHAGGAIYHSQSNVKLYNCTIAQNSATYDGGGSYQQGGSLSITNSILWKNRHGTAFETSIERAQIFTEFGGSVGVGYSCIEGLSTYTGNNNVSDDPLFTEPLAGNFYLDFYSPVGDVGNNQALNGETVDLPGVPRVMGTTVDMGAYERGVIASSPLRFTSLPDSQSTCAENTVMFTVTGPGATNVSWFVKSGAFFGPVPMSAPYSVISNSTSSTLVISNVTAAMNGYQYRFAIAGTTFNSAPVKLTVSPRSVIYVKANAAGSNNGSSWSNALTNMQSALDMADSCSEVWVAAGTYTVTPGINNQQYFRLKNDLKVYGGFAGTEALRTQRDWTNNVTVLKGNGVSPAFWNIASHYPVNRGAELDGFTINGNGNTGMNNVSVSPTIRNCIFDNCAGAMRNTASSPWLENCTFTNSASTAMINGNGSVLFITNCVFAASTNALAAGGAMYNWESTVTIARSIFRNNHASSGAAIFQESGALTVSDALFDANTATSLAGAIYNSPGATTTVRNSVFSKNRAHAGGGLANYGQMTLINCTVAANMGSTDGVGLYQGGGSATLLNSIVWGNVATLGDFYGTPPQQRQIFGSVTASNTCVQGLASLSGNGNIGYDPLFVSTASSDWRLESYSPAIDAGSNIYAAGITKDFAGNNRFAYGTVDMGAYEAQLSAHNPVRIFAMPTSQISCVGGTARFSINTEVGVTVQWQYNNGSGWTPSSSGPFAASFAVTQTNTTSYLTIANVTALMTNCQFRLFVSGTSYFTPPVTLTVNPPEVVYVNALRPPGGDGRTWETAYDRLDTALNNTDVCRKVLWVAAGTYYPTPTTNQTWSFDIRSDLQLYGGFNGTETDLSQRNWQANPTILSGDIGVSGVSSDNSDNIISFDAGATTNAILDGFIVQNGRRGFLVFNASPTIQNCTFRDNTLGGGLFTYSRSTVKNCSFVGNLGSSGAGLSVWGVNTNTSPVTIDSCVISGNVATNSGGGLYTQGADVRVINSIITGNSSIGAFGAGGWYASGGNSTMTNSTVAGNYTTSSSGGGLLPLNFATIAVRNSIIWGNQSTSANDEISQVSNIGDPISIVASCVQGLSLYTGNGNIAYDPQFVSSVTAQATPTTNGNWRLQSCSPAINAGNNTYVTGITNDLAGAARPIGIVDMGAYEFQGVTSAAMAITGSPGSITYCGTASNYFQVTATGSGLTYQWQINPNGSGFVSLTNDLNYSGTATAVLVVSNATYELNGTQFRCIVSSDAGCSASSRAATLTVRPTRFYVNGAASTNGNGLSWATAFTNVYDAMTLAAFDTCGSNEVWVAAGVYPARPNASVALRFKNRVMIYGGFNGTETSRNQRDWTNNVTVIDALGSTAFAAGLDAVDSSAGVDGFVLRNGTTGIANGGAGSPPYPLCTPVIANCVFSNFTGYAVYNSQAQPTIRNCQISNVDVGIYNTGSTPTIEDCRFTANRIAIQGSSTSSATVRRCIMAGHTGNAVSWLQGAPLFEDNLFITNSTTAVYLLNANATVNRCIFRGNQASSGAGLSFSGGTITVANSVFSGNHATSDSGAIYGSSGVIYMRNCSFVGNKGDSAWGAMYLSSGVQAYLYNSVIWNNSGAGSDAQSSQMSGYYIEARNNCIQNLIPNASGVTFYASSGNVSSDPGFVATIDGANAPSTSGDLRLNAFSSILNLGDNGRVHGASDLAGAARLFGNVDIGAYEYQGAAGVLVTLAEALDTTDTTWTTGGNVAPFGQTLDSNDGIDAARLGGVSDSQESWFSTSVAGPANVAFAWRVSSETNSDFLELRVDGNLQTRISGQTGWRQQNTSVLSGAHIVQWRYVRDSAGSGGDNAGWVDQMTITLPEFVTVMVTTNADGGPGSLRQAIIDSTGLPIPVTIDLSGISGTVTLTNALPFLTGNMTITGPGASNLTISGQNLYRPFFIEASNRTVNFNNLTIANGRAKGGNGGNRAGGGAGLGGAMFVNAGNVTVSNVLFSGNTAAGGSGGNGGGPTAGGGGGGLGGNGGTAGSFGGGGGGGFAGNGGNGGQDGGGGGGGIVGRGGNGANAGGGGGGTVDGNSASGTIAGTGAGGGGNGANYNSGTGGAGSLYGGGGGGGYNGSNLTIGTGGAGGRFGGGGGGAYYFGAGGAGGEFGGGGGQNAGDSPSYLPNSAAGGFGGGGGAGHYNAWNLPGGRGGFGGGGGSGPDSSRRGTSVAFGGQGAVGSTQGGGGGGAALGAAVFVRANNGATFTCINSTADAGTLTAGPAGTGGSGATAGSTSGSAFFIIGGTNTFAVDAGVTSTIAGSIGGWNDVPSTLAKTGTGTLILGGVNSYIGATLVSAGTLQVNGNNSASSGITVSSGATLSGTGTVASVTFESGSTVSPGSTIGTFNAGNTVWSGAGNYNWQITDATGAAGTGYDLYKITGTLNVSAASGFKINVWSLVSTNPQTSGLAANFSAATARSWTIVQTTGGIVGFNANNFVIVTNAANGNDGFVNGTAGQFTLSVSGNNLLLNYTPVPPQVTTTAATAITRYAGSLNGTVAVNNQPTTVYFQYGLTTNYSATTAPVVVSVDGSFTAPISGLQSGTVYNFRAVATNIAGTAFGTNRTFTTLANTAPVAAPQSLTTAEDTALSITLTGSDADTDPITYAIVTSPAHGTLSGTPPNVVYTPNTNRFGSDSFTFRVNDGFVNSAPATISINVTAVADVAGTTLGIQNLGNGNVQLTIQGEPLATYRVWVSGELGSWSELRQSTANGLGVVTFTDTTGSTKRFYRLEQLP